MRTRNFAEFNDLARASPQLQVAGRDFLHHTACRRCPGGTHHRPNRGPNAISRGRLDFGKVNSKWNYVHLCGVSNAKIAGYFALLLFADGDDPVRRVLRQNSFDMNENLRFERSVVAVEIRAREMYGPCDISRNED